MKTIKNTLALLVLLLFVSNNISAQDCETASKPQTIEAVYDGMCSDNYSFMNDANSNAPDFLFFDNIAKDQWKKYKLDDEKYKGMKFRITYTTNGVTEIDEDGDEQCYSKNKITFLTLLE